MQLDDTTYFALVNEQLADGQHVRLVLKGRSMTPTLHEGDHIILEPLQGEPTVGDVYLFRILGRHMLHRLVLRRGDTLVMQGDNNYSCEHIAPTDLRGRLVAVQRPGGPERPTDGRAWRAATRWCMVRSAARRVASRWLSADGRRRLRPWYFGLLAILMWAPLNGLGVPLDNYILGLRADHLLHASVYLPCVFLLKDLFPQRLWLAWLCALPIGLLTESVQYLLPYRGFDINDLVANALGTTLGWLALLISRRLRRTR